MYVVKYVKPDNTQIVPLYLAGKIEKGRCTYCNTYGLSTYKKVMHSLKIFSFKGATQHIQERQLEAEIFFFLLFFPFMRILTDDDDVVDEGATSREAVLLPTL